MLVLAISIKGKEFMYSASSSHKVPKKSAEKIRDILNACKYHLKEDQIWYIHELGYYDNGYYYAQDQRFSIYRGSVKEHIENTW